MTTALASIASCTDESTDARGDVVVHWLDLTVATDCSALSRDEVSRARQFRFDRHRRRFVTRRAHLRHLLARTVGVAAEQLRFGATPHGRPFLPDHPEIHFSTSSSGDHAVVALSASELGIDIERLLPDRADLDVARGLFAPEEIAALTAAGPAAFPRSFFHCWTRKEAYVKAIGVGLSFPLDAFAVEVHDTLEPRLLRSTLRPADVESCSMRTLVPPATDCVAALVVRHRAPTVRPSPVRHSPCPAPASPAAPC